MLFNSIDFALFLPIVFLIYWGIAHKSIKFQNILIVFASYTFYGWWDWRFLFLIATSTLVDFFIGIALRKYHSQKKRKVLLWLSILTNLGILGFFKYYNFFLDNFVNAFSLFGKEFSISSLQIIVPVGISFYTFQTLSYSIDVYKKKITPTTDFVAFTAFVCFFPQLVAGPIERAKHLLPQFERKRFFKYEVGVDGLKQILWGLFKKMVIADTCAQYADIAFAGTTDYTGSSLALGVLFFSFQIYADFSGYSDIAIGVARLFGFELKQNFATPYFSSSIVEFWKRWHISLSTWFRDYVYIPLGGSRVSTIGFVRNILLVFIVSGFWHGASWTFIIWGLFHAIIYLATYYFTTKGKVRENITVSNKIIYAFKIVMTFSIVSVGWVFFRAADLHAAFEYISHLFSVSLLSFPDFISNGKLMTLLLLLFFLLVIEWQGRCEPHILKTFMHTKPKLIRWLFYSFLVLCIGVFVNTADTPFIYFQF